MSDWTRAAALSAGYRGEGAGACVDERVGRAVVARLRACDGANAAGAVKEVRNVAEVVSGVEGVRALYESLVAGRAGVERVLRGEVEGRVVWMEEGVQDEGCRFFERCAGGIGEKVEGVAWVAKGSVEAEVVEAAAGEVEGILRGVQGAFDSVCAAREAGLAVRRTDVPSAATSTSTLLPGVPDV